ncbi:MAG: YtxH domain-containing protein [Thermonemataceae bacterium]
MENKRERNNNNLSRTIFAVLAGTSMGIVAGMLLAPNSGEESRKKAMNQAKDLKALANEKIKEVSTKVKEAYDQTVYQASTKAKEASTKAKEAYDEALYHTTAKAKNTVTNVKEKLEDAEDVLNQQLEKERTVNTEKSINKRLKSTTT